MKKFTSTFTISAAFVVLAVSGAFADSTSSSDLRLSEAELIQQATERGICGENRFVTSARYVNDTENRVTVTCDDKTIVPLVAGGLGGAGAGAAAAVLVGIVAAVAAGGGGSTPDTQ